MSAIVLNPRPARPSMPSFTPVHLTRRGRLLRSVLLMVLMAATAFVLVGRVALATGASLPAGSASSGPVTVEVTVRDGESLWLIARRVSPGADPREIVARTRELNHLRTNMIHPGQLLVVPVLG